MLQEAPVPSDIFTTTGVVTILAAFGVLVTTIFTAYTAYRSKIATEEVKKVNLDQVVKLENIEILVDGRYSAVLQELADVKNLLAISTGLPSDELKANKAQVIADEQAKQVGIVASKKD